MYFPQAEKLVNEKEKAAEFLLSDFQRRSFCEREPLTSIAWQPSISSVSHGTFSISYKSLQKEA